MADISVKRVSEILRLVFDLLWFEPQGLYASEIMRYIRTTVPLSEFEKGQYPFAPYSQRYETIIRVGTIPLVRAGWMQKTKSGRWLITDAGREAMKRYKNSEEFFQESVRMFQEWNDQKQNKLAQLSSNPYNFAVENSWEQIRQYIDMLEINELREVVATLLKALGCNILWSASENDTIENELIDLICYRDPLGFSSSRILVHIANRSQVSTSEGLTMFRGLLKEGEVGLFITFGGATSQLKDFALNHTQNQIRLIDLEKFIELWIENLEKIDWEKRNLLPLKPIYFLSFPENA